jgi:uncharacterized protein (UPF0335 family)
MDAVLEKLAIYAKGPTRQLRDFDSRVTRELVSIRPALTREAGSHIERIERLESEPCQRRLKIDPFPPAEN